MSDLVLRPTMPAAAASPRAQINDKVTVVRIENNVRKESTIYAEEAVHELTTKVILSAPMSDDPVVRDLQMASKANFMQAMFYVLEPLFRRCQTATEIATREAIKKGN